MRYSWTSQKKLALELRTSLSTVKRAYKRLQQLGFMTVKVKHQCAGVGICQVECHPHFWTAEDLEMWEGKTLP